MDPEEDHAMTDEEFIVAFMHHAALMNHGCDPEEIHSFEEMAEA